MASWLPPKSVDPISCDGEPDFAVICDFFQKFSTLLRMEVPNIEELSKWLSDTQNVPLPLVHLHITLIRKIRKVANEKNWIVGLKKFCMVRSPQDLDDLNEFSYAKTKLGLKLRLLRLLLEEQFTHNPTFRKKTTSLSANSLRSNPLGRDRWGNSYWLILSAEPNIRVFKEHVVDGTWETVAKNREELVELIAMLKSQQPREVQPKKDNGSPAKDGYGPSHTSSDSLNELPLVSVEPETLPTEREERKKTAMLKAQNSGEVQAKEDKGSPAQDPYAPSPNSSGSLDELPLAMLKSQHPGEVKDDKGNQLQDAYEPSFSCSDSLDELPLFSAELQKLLAERDECMKTDFESPDSHISYDDTMDVDPNIFDF